MSLKVIREALIRALWERYAETLPVMPIIAQAFAARGDPLPPLDHFAVIDLPSSKTGIPVLRAIFERLGFEYRGSDYLPDKQNDFTWLAEQEATKQAVTHVLPQVVVADFRLSALPSAVADIVSRYAAHASSFPFALLDDYLKKVDDAVIQARIVQLIMDYFKGRDWPLPKCHEFETVKATNELLAWVLVHGRKPNHFTLAIHLSHAFNHFEAFLNWLEEDLSLILNYQAGRIKGHVQSGIEQASTQGLIETIQLEDGMVQLPSPFVEFVWRYSRLPFPEKPKLWADYFTDFIPQHANHVVESLYDARVNEVA